MAPTKATLKRPLRAPQRRSVLRVVEGGRRPSRRQLLPVAVVLVLGVFAVTALQAYLAQEGFRAARLEKQVRKAQEDYVLLRRQVAQLSSPGRLAESAAKLGMTDPADPVFLQAPSAGTGPDDSGTRPAYADKPLLSEVP